MTGCRMKKMSKKIENNSHDRKNKNQPTSQKHLAASLSAASLAFAAFINVSHAFIVQDIKVRGLQRVSVGTVLNYLPVQVGEDLDENETGSVVRALYETGFFQNVALERQGNTLVVHVTERATIGSINLSGNKEIPTDQLKGLLKQAGLVKGRVFQSASLEYVEKELKQAYTARGKYNAKVSVRVTSLTENRVAITISISEGRVSRIKELNITGNKNFTTDELRSQFTLSTSGVLTYFTKKDQYSKPSWDASLEALRAYYLDRGYLKFKIISSQVMLSPDKKDVYMNVHISEGPQYHFSGYTVVGKTIISRDKVNSLIQVKKGDVFSRKKVTESISAIGQAMGDAGYGFPLINAEPQIDEKNKTVFLTFVVEPGRHVYVRRINFHGNVKTADYVLRNVLRQNEGSLLSLHNIKESERQLRLLSYLKNIDIKTTPVPGTNNQVDLDVTIEEAPTAEATASVGYGTNGPVVNAAFNQYNFMGTGRSVGLGFNASYWGQDYSFSYYNPFFTTTGIGSGINVYYQTFDPRKLDVASYSSERFGTDLNFTIPIAEKSSFLTGVGFQTLTMKSAKLVPQVQNFVDLYGRHFQEMRLNAAINRNSYDQMPYPTQGTNQRLTGLVALPASSNAFTYYKVDYQARWYQPLYRGTIFTLLGNVAYGNQFNGQGLPVFENYYAGGIAQPGQVRGYGSFSLGPKDLFGNALGGNLLVNGSAGLILPYPLSRDTVRTTIFTDVGNVYSYGLPFLLRGTASGPMRYSAGVSVEWRSPFGPLAFNVAKALNPQILDDTQYFQLAMSANF